MTEYHFPVPGSEREEEIVLFIHRHWVSFLGHFILSFLMIFVPIIIFVVMLIIDKSILQGILLNILAVILSIYYLVALTFTFMSWITYYYDIYIITKSEIIDVTQTGFFGRKISRLSLLRVQDVSSTIKGFLPTIFAYGDVLVETAGEQSSNFLLDAVPNPQECTSKIMNLHDELIESEGRRGQVLEAEGVLAPTNSRSETLKPIRHKTEQESFTKTIQKKESSEENSSKTAYQKLLEKDDSSVNRSSSNEGKISKDDLDQGGEIDLK